MTVSRWFTSTRTFSADQGSSSSSSASIPCVVPQSAIWTILYSLNNLPLSLIILKYIISFHCYANDAQINLPVKPLDQCPWNNLWDCIADIRMDNYSLQLKAAAGKILFLTFLITDTLKHCVLWVYYINQCNSSTEISDSQLSQRGPLHLTNQSSSKRGSLPAGSQSTFCTPRPEYRLEG